MELKEKLMKLEERIAKYPGLCYFHRGVSQKQIYQAEQRLGILFPISYCWFLMTYGAGSFGSTEFFGILTDDTGQTIPGRSIPDLVWVTKELRRRYELPETCFAFYGDGFGNYFCGENADKVRLSDGRLAVLHLEEDRWSYQRLEQYTVSSFMEELIDTEIRMREEDADGIL